MSPTEVSADGMLRTPRVVGARDAGHPAAGVPRRRLGLAAARRARGVVHRRRHAGARARRATSPRCTGRSPRTRCWPTAWPPRPRSALLADRAAAGTAALLIGLADRMLAMAAAYAKERHQFGKPIGSFQAVKHLLANARVALEFARPATYRAAWSLATAQPTLSHDASMAKAMASDAADLAARVALQVHGAIGYTWECDLHFFLKQTWALSRAWGDAATHRRLVLAHALGR